MSLSVTTSNSASNNWAWGTYSGSYISQQFYVPYNSGRVDPAGTFYMGVQQVSMYGANATSNTDATVKTFAADSATKSGAVSSGTITLSNTSMAEKIGTLTTTKYFTSTASNTTIKYFGFTITNAGYGNQWYDATGGTLNMYVNGTQTNGSTGPYKWGSSTTRWESASALAGKLYYATLPAAPSAPTGANYTGSVIQMTVGISADDGYNVSTGTGNAVTSYKIQFSTNGSTWTTYPTDISRGTNTTTETISLSVGGTNQPQIGNSYYFRYALINDVATDNSTTSAWGAATSTAMSLISYGERFIGIGQSGADANGYIKVTTAKRFVGVGVATTNGAGTTIYGDANGYVPITASKRFNGTAWVDVTN
jgi:hypothetical protein